MRTFGKLREVTSDPSLAHKINELENRYDKKFKIVFDAIRELMTGVPSEQRKKIKPLSD